MKTAVIGISRTGKTFTLRAATPRRRLTYGASPRGFGWTLKGIIATGFRTAEAAVQEAARLGLTLNR